MSTLSLISVARRLARVAFSSRLALRLDSADAFSPDFAVLPFAEPRGRELAPVCGDRPRFDAAFKLDRRRERMRTCALALLQQFFAEVHPLQALLARFVALV